MKNVENYIEVYGGDKFCFDDISKNEVDIKVIAHALSLQCRYAGHCKVFYSVAEHSVLMADALYESTGEASVAFEALMHDATEAYVTDIPRPMKAVLPDFKRMEDEVYKLIADKFDLPPQISELVKKADSQIVKDERAQIMIESDNIWAVDDLDYLNVFIDGLSPTSAEREFLSAFIFYDNLRKGKSL